MKSSAGAKIVSLRAENLFRYRHRSRDTSDKKKEWRGGEYQREIRTCRDFLISDENAGQGKITAAGRIVRANLANGGKSGQSQRAA